MLKHYFNGTKQDLQHNSKWCSILRDVIVAVWESTSKNVEIIDKLNIETDPLFDPNTCLKTKYIAHNMRIYKFTKKWWWYSILQKVNVRFPQEGSILGPYLYYTRYLPSTREVTITIFADDTALIAIGNSIKKFTDIGTATYYKRNK